MEKWGNSGSKTCDGVEAQHEGKEGLKHASGFGMWGPLTGLEHREAEQNTKMANCTWSMWRLRSAVRQPREMSKGQSVVWL